MLDDACSWREVRVEAIDDDEQRARVSTVVVGGGAGREFLGLNRARHAVLEASILASRARLLDGRGHPRRAAPAAGARGQDGRSARARGDGRTCARWSETRERSASRRPRACTSACSRSPATARGASAGSGWRSAARRSCSRREPADELSAEGADAERALTFARRCRDALGLAGGAHLRVVEAIPPHVGLGSGTKLALAVAQALAALHGRDGRRAGAGRRRPGARRARRWACGRSRSAASWSRAACGAARSARRRCWRATRCRRSGGSCSSCPTAEPGLSGAAEDAGVRAARAVGRAVGGDRAARAHVAAAGARRARRRGVRRPR